MADELTITWLPKPVAADSCEWNALTKETSIDLSGPPESPVSAMLAVFPPVEGWRVGILRGTVASLIALCQEALGEVSAQPVPMPVSDLGELSHLIASSRRLREVAENAYWSKCDSVVLVQPAYFAAAMPPQNLPITPAAGGAVPIAHVDQPSRRGSMGAFGLPAADRGAAFIRQERHHG